MKKLFFLVNIALTTICQSGHSQNVRQDGSPDNHAKLVVQKAGEQPVTYIFTNEMGVDYNCIVRNEGTSLSERTTDFGFLSTFEKGGKDIDVNVNLNLAPNETGTFILSNNLPSEATSYSNISIEFNNTEGPFLGQDVSKGTNGSITITHFPKVSGDYIVGTFKARLLGDDNQMYQVSGEFKVQRIDQ